jgi:hypothetical protein
MYIEIFIYIYMYIYIQDNDVHALEKKKYKIVNVFCAGDDDQSIYANRGAKVELMHRFRFEFPGCRVLKFGMCI